MSELQSHTETSIGSPRGFGIVFAIVFAAIALWPLLNDGAVRLWALAGSAVFAGLAAFAPARLQPLNRLWFKFGILLGHIFTPLIMGILFFLIFTPMALMLRLLDKDLLNLKLKPQADSYWLKRDTPERKMGSMKNQF